MSRGLRIHWRSLVGLLLAVVLFLPPRRYEVPASLPFELDPYRLVVMGLIFVWLLSALSDADLPLRGSGLEGPLFVFAIGVVGSIAANPDRVSAYQTNVVKYLSVLIGFALVFYLVVNVIRTRDACGTVLAVLVLGGAVLGALAIVEQRYGWSPFIDLDRHLFLLKKSGVDVENLQGVLSDRGVRAFASAEHPIALGALLAMLAPIAAALALTRRRRAVWGVCLILLVLGSFATGSRTPVVMLAAWALAFAVLRWQDTKRFMPLALATLALVHLSMPGTLGALRSLNPEALVQEHRTKPDSLVAAGRISDLAPSFEEFRQRPVFGHGVGTRITIGERANARLLDNQWLGTVLDTGLVGLIGLVWLLGRFIRRVSQASLSAGADGIVLAALAAAVLSYAVGMFTYDALSFTQITLVLFVLLAVGRSLVLAREAEPELRSEEPPGSTPSSPALQRVAPT